MIVRMLVATVGAVVITAVMLLGMGEFASMFRERSGDRYFLITDILPAPERGRPERPPDAARPPEGGGFRLPTGDPDLPLDPLDDPSPTVAIGADPVLPSPDDDFELVPE